MDTLKIKLLSDTAKVPSRATDGSAGYDLRANTAAEITIEPGEIRTIPTGISVALPGKNYVAVVCARSGLAIKHGISLANGVGIIDSDYRGEIAVGLVNLSKTSYTVAPGERIAQLLIMPVETPDIVVVDEIGETVRGDGGFGSTGKK